MDEHKADSTVTEPINDSIVLVEEDVVNTVVFETEPIEGDDVISLNKFIKLFAFE